MSTVCLRKKYFALTFSVSLLLVLFSFQNSHANNELLIKMRPLGDKNGKQFEQEYKYQLLTLILDKTISTYGPYRIEFIPTTDQRRVIEMISRGDATLIMTMTSQERENTLRPIRIPIYKGLYGYRIFIIHKDNEPTFATINSLKQLKKLSAGQGHTWPDFEILKHAGFPVVGGTNYAGLFKMLAHHRFDFFPRGVHEPFKEVAAHTGLDLIVEKHLCLHYPAPGYIFVAKENKQLAQRLEQGFQTALKDGSFNKLFHTHPDVAKALKQAKLNERLIFAIPNPLLSPETPLDDKKLWYAP